MNAITSGENELGLDLCFNELLNFASRARLGNGKNANFRLLCSTKTQVENQAPTEQNAWPDIDFCDENSSNWRLTGQ